MTLIDTAKRCIQVEDLEKQEKKIVQYDRLVLATGARSRRLGLPGEEADNFHTLKDLQDAIRIRAYVDRERPKRAAILGSGYIGLEMAEAFQRRGIETFIIYRGERPVSRLEPEQSEGVLKELEDNGVRFLAGHQTTGLAVNGQGVVTSVETSQGSYPVDIVLSALGVEAETDLAREAGLPLGETGAIRTDREQRTKKEDIFVAGDCCEVFHRVLEEWVHMPLGDIANKQGRVAGENAADGTASFHGIVGSQCFQVFSLEVASTGITEEAAKRKGLDVGVQKIQGFSKVHYMPGAQRLFLKLIFEKNSGRVLGAHMAGKEGVARRINTLAMAVQSGMTVKELSRMDFAYAPTFSPAFDPILIAAEQSLKKLG